MQFRSRAKKLQSSKSLVERNVFSYADDFSVCAGSDGEMSFQIKLMTRSHLLNILRVSKDIAVPKRSERTAIVEENMVVGKICVSSFPDDFPVYAGSDGEMSF